MKKTHPIPSVLAMPPRQHYPDRARPFHVLNSDVVKWLLAQEDVAQWLFNKMRERGWIRYDRETGTWRGSEYVDCPRRKPAP